MSLFQPHLLRLLAWLTAAHQVAQVVGTKYNRKNGNDGLPTKAIALYQSIGKVSTPATDLLVLPLRRQKFALPFPQQSSRVDLRIHPHPTSSTAPTLHPHPHAAHPHEVTHPLFAFAIPKPTLKPFPDGSCASISPPSTANRPHFVIAFKSSNCSLGSARSFWNDF